MPASHNPALSCLVQLCGKLRSPRKRVPFGYPGSNPGAGVIFKMNHKTLETLAYILLFLLVLNIIFLFLLKSPVEEFSSNELTGNMEKFEVYHEDYSIKQLKTEEKYNKKLLDYLDSKQTSRETTFFR